MRCVDEKRFPGRPVRAPSCSTNRRGVARWALPLAFQGVSALQGLSSEAEVATVWQSGGELAVDTRRRGLGGGRRGRGAGGGCGRQQGAAGRRAEASRKQRGALLRRWLRGAAKVGAGD